MTTPDTDTLAGLLDYDAGLLNDWGDGNVEWWQDYLRAEIGRANDHWRIQAQDLSASHAAMLGDFAERTADDIAALRAQTAKDKARIERLSSYLASCIAMIEHAIRPGRDVFIEPDTKRRLSDARAALEDGE